MQKRKKGIRPVDVRACSGGDWDNAASDIGGVSSHFANQEDSNNNGLYTASQYNYDNYLFDYANQYNYYEHLYTWMPPNYSCWNNQFSTSYYDSIYESYLKNNQGYAQDLNYLSREPYAPRLDSSLLDNGGVTSSSANNPLRGLSKDDLGFEPPVGFSKPSEPQVDLSVKPSNSEITPIISKEKIKPKIDHKKYVIINAPTNLKGLIEIIDTNEISDDIEYNIDIKSLKSIKTELIELRDMIGMEKMKESVFQQLVYFVQNLHIGTDKNSGDFKHTVIMGPPGTGKTRVAKIIGNMYAKLGILKKNLFKKVTRNDLIAGYLGQTAIKTQKVIEDCLGGVLFIDEAYSLANEDRDDSFSKECLDTLCEALSDHKDDLMVIIAGYESELNNRFFNSNRGLESRFIWRFKIEEYSAAELMRIYLTIVVQSGWEMLDDQMNERWFQEKKDKFQGLGRDMEVLFTYTKMAHSLRIYGKDIEVRRKISLEDMDKAYKIFVDNLKKDERPSFINSIYI